MMRMDQMDTKIIRWETGGKVPVVLGYRYHKYRVSGRHIVWRCWRRRTRSSRVRTSFFNLDTDGGDRPQDGGDRP